MSRTFSVSLNNSEKLIVLNKFKIEERQIGTLCKTILLKPEIALKPEEFNQKKEEIKQLEEKTVDEVSKEVEGMSLKELKKELGIGVRNQQNKRDQKGLYFGNNLETYLKKFIDNWDRKLWRIPELCASVSMMAKEEILATEYSKRIK